MFNIAKFEWVPSGKRTPKFDTPVFILVEHDVVHDVNEQAPFVRTASLHRYDREPRILYWKLLDYDPETEEEILQQCFSVISWRYVDGMGRQDSRREGKTRSTQ